MEIYLIRHTAPDIGTDVCYGQSDVPASYDFETNLRFILKNIPASLDAVFMSPSRRCTQTGDRIEAGVHAKDSRLMELNFGEWELKRWEEIDPDVLGMWMADFVNRVVPGGESFKQLFARVSSFIVDLEPKPFQRVAVITHAGVIRCFVLYLLGMPLENAFRVAVDYGSITKLELGANPLSPKVAYLNRTKAPLTDIS